MRIPKVITAEFISRLSPRGVDACRSGLVRFNERFPNGAKLTRENLEKVLTDYRPDVYWFVKGILGWNTEDKIYHKARAYQRSYKGRIPFHIVFRKKYIELLMRAIKSRSKSKSQAKKKVKAVACRKEIS